MNRQRILQLVIVFMLVMVLSIAGCGSLPPVMSTPTAPPATATKAITDDDKAAVTRLALEFALLGNDTSFGGLNHASNIVLSTENLDPSWVPQLDGVNIVLLSPDKIQAKSDKEGIYMYLRFDRFEIRDDGRIVVRLYDHWTRARPGGPIQVFPGVGGCTWEYHRENGGWIAETAECVIS